jgi:hypothetical protein
MNLITRNNYESFFLDYVEENMSPEQIAELMLFLEKNPDLKEELEDYKALELIPPSYNLEDKYKLKKEEGLITIDNYEDFIIQEIEGENTSETSKLLHLFLEKNPNKQSEFLTYQKTKLIAPSVIFTAKKSLKKKEGKVIPMYWWYSSAAAVIMVFFLLKGFVDDGSENNHSIVNNKEVLVPELKDENLIQKNQEKEEPLFNEDVKSVAVVTDKSIENQKKKSNKKLFKKLIKEEESPKLIAEQLKDELKIEKNDSLDIESLDEEILYADDVRIVYADDVINENNIPPVNKTTKFDAVRAVVKHQVNENLLDKGKEKLLLAFNSNPLNFIRGKKKK